MDRAAVEMGPGRLGAVFRWYRGRHVRLTERLSRAQEAAVDGLSLRVAGAEASAEALRRSALGGRLFDAYLEAHVEPLAQAGLRPLDLYGEFRGYCFDPGIAQRAGGLLECLLEDEGHPSDTHPPLAARLAALGGSPTTEGVPFRLAAEQPVTGLLADPDRVVARSCRAGPVRWAPPRSRGRCWSPGVAGGPRGCGARCRPSRPRTSGACWRCSRAPGARWWCAGSCPTWTGCRSCSGARSWTT
ncbi:MAG: hypothetical protein M3P95_07180 [Actinomycetota bacterium]|nr:hypothetical protein [Actinomycetota bacterium]